jgi:hypothetical protein
MILAAALIRTELRQWKRLEFKQVRLLSSGRDDICVLCKEANGRVYAMESAPELPPEKCTCEYGCGCLFVVD